MKCLVVGGYGYLGSHLAERLVKYGHDVRILGKRRRELGFGGQVEEFVGEFTDESLLRTALEGVEVLVHCASTTVPAQSNLDIEGDIYGNVVGTIRLLEHAVAAGVRRVVFLSSGGTVYGEPKTIPTDESHATDPICSYGICKLAIEKYLALFYRLHGLDYCILRIANPYGGRQNPAKGVGAVTTFLQRTYDRVPIEIWGDGRASRDYIFIDDVVAALTNVIERQPPSTIYNIGSGTPHTLNAIIELIAEVTLLTPEVNYLPTRLADVSVNCLDVSLARNELNWEPRVVLRQGIQKLWGQFRQYE